MNSRFKNLLSRRGPSAAASLFCAVLLAACGGGQAGKGGTQVAATVNNEEVSVHQVAFLLERQPGLKPELAEQAGRELLERLIDQELAVQKAKQLSLDRDPRVVQALDAARREVLARAYLERVSEGGERPGAPEIDKFYADNPGLFKNRRLYWLHDFSIQATPEQMPAVQALVQAGKSVQAISDKLSAAGLRFTARALTQSAEGLPLDWLNKLAALNDGQTLLLAQPDGTVKALLLLAAAPAPIAEAQARPMIEQYLLNDRKRKKLLAEAQGLRAGAAIQYLGKFAPGPGGATAGGAAASGAVATEAAAKALK